MKSLYEYSDILNKPYEAFYFNTAIHAFPISPHWHYFMEIVYVTDGLLMTESDGQIFQMQKGDLVLYHPQAVHSMYCKKNEQSKYIVLKFDINRLNTISNYAPKFRTIFHNAKGLASAPILLPSSFLSGTALPRLITDYLEEVTNQEYGYDMLANADLCGILTIILRYWQSLGFEIDKVLPINADVFTISNITEYITAHSGDHLRVTELAALCNMSYSHFAKSFRELYGQSCIEYMEFLRVCQVEDYLMFTECDLSFISQETGFSDCSHLIRTFKRLRGITPKQFKMKRKKEGILH